MIINVLPISEKKLLRKEYALRLATVSFCLFSILSIVATLLLLPSYTFSQSKAATLEAQVSDFNLSHPELSENDLRKIISEINQTLIILDAGKSKRIVSVDVFNTILSLRPLGVRFSQVFYMEDGDGKGTLEIRGNAIDRTALKALETAFESDPHIASVDLPVSSFTKRINIDFVLKVVMK